MIATKRFINHLRHKCRIDIDETLERYILSIYESEPFPYVWTEQDLYEQIRKLADSYNNGSLDIPPIPSKVKRFRKRQEELQSDFIDLITLYYERCGELPKQFDCFSAVVEADIFSQWDEENVVF